MTGFKDFQLKPELLRAIKDCGFEHPSEGAPAVECAFTDYREVVGFFGDNLVMTKYVFSHCSSVGVHPPSSRRHRHSLPSQVGDGKDGCVRTVDPTPN